MSHIIAPMKKVDITAVSSLHRKVFYGSRSTKLGRAYINKMFSWFIKYNPGLSFVSKKNEKVSGYVVGAIGGYGRKLFRYAFFEILFGLLFHPKLWFQRQTFLLWRSYLKGLTPQNKSTTVLSDQPLITKAALAGIGVDPDQQGQGIGSLLVIAFEEAAKELGVNKLTLSVNQDNFNARHLYDRLGWSVDSENISANTVHFTKVIA